MAYDVKWRFGDQLFDYGPFPSAAEAIHVAKIIADLLMPGERKADAVWIQNESSTQIVKNSN
jgi:hypothetical protein